MPTQEQLEKRRINQARYRAENKDKCNEATRRWAVKNRERIAAKNKKWREDNPEKVRQMYLNQRAKHGPNWETERKRQQKYGISPEEFKSMFDRQQGRCLITRDILTEKSHVDHSHETGAVRGLLSNNANAALGFLREDPEAFYRAVAYLTLDRSKKLVYVIGSLRNKIIPDVAAQLRDAGFDAFDNWFSAGEKADDSWQEYSRRKGLTFVEALQSREANHVFRFDKAYLDLCDAAVLVMPAGKSGFLELGYVLGMNKPAYVLLDEDTEKNRYDVMPQFADMITSDIEFIIEDLNSKETGD